MLNQQPPRKYPTTTQTYNVDFETLIFALNASGVLADCHIPSNPRDRIRDHVKLTVGGKTVCPEQPLIVELTKLQPGPDPRLAGYRHMR